MRVLVTGAGGFVGQRLCRILATEGHEVTALFHPESVPRASAILQGCAARILGLDLADLQSADLPQSADAVITLAQARNFRDFPARAEETFAVNVLANVRLLQWAAAAGVRTIVHASSGGIYGGRPAGQFHETDLLAVDSPIGFYLGSKLCSEIVLQNFRQFFSTTVILRPFFIYGPMQRKDMFVARLIESVRSGRPIQLQGRDGLRINPVFVEDAAVAFARALKLEGSHVINVAGPDIVTLRELADTIGGLTGRAPVFEAKDGAPVDYVGDTVQAERKLGMQLTRLAPGLLATLGI